MTPLKSVLFIRAVVALLTDYISSGRRWGSKALSLNYRQSLGKQIVIECRVCGKSMKFQNYQPHLKFKHPREDWKNLRGKSDTSIKNMFENQNQTKVKKRPASDINEAIHPTKKFSSESLVLNKVNNNNDQEQNNFPPSSENSTHSDKSDSMTVFQQTGDSSHHNDHHDLVILGRSLGDNDNIFVLSHFL